MANIYIYLFIWFSNRHISKKLKIARFLYWVLVCSPKKSEIFLNKFYFNIAKIG